MEKKNEPEVRAREQMDRVIELLELLNERKDPEFVPDDAERLMTVKEVAKRMGTGLNTVYGFIKSGMLPALRFRASMKVRKSTFNRFIEEYENKDLLAELDMRRSGMKEEGKTA